VKLSPQLALWLGLLLATAVPATTGESGGKLADSPPALGQPAALMREKLLDQKDIRARLMAAPPGSGTITRRNDGRRQKSTTADAPPALKRISSRIHTLHKQPASQRMARPVRQLRASNRNPARFKIAMDASTGTVRNIRGAFPASSKAQPASALFSDFARGFVEENRALFNLDHAQQELRLMASWNDQLGQDHAKYQLMHKGLPVLNEQISVHGRGGDIYFVNARYGRPQLALAAAISAEAAIDSALAHLGSSTAQLQQPARAELVVALHKGSYRQAWQVQLLLKDMMRWEYLIDAAQGSVLRFQRTIHSELVNAAG